MDERRSREWASCPDLTAPAQVMEQERAHGRAKEKVKDKTKYRAKDRTRERERDNTAEVEAEKCEDCEMQNDKRGGPLGRTNASVVKEKFRDGEQSMVQVSEPYNVQYNVTVDRTTVPRVQGVSDLRSNDKRRARRTDGVWCGGHQDDAGYSSPNERHKAKFGEERPHHRLKTDWDRFRSTPDLSQDCTAMTERQGDQVRSEEVINDQLHRRDFRGQPAEWYRSRLGPPGSVAVVRTEHPPPLQTPPLLQSVYREERHHRSSPDLQHLQHRPSAHQSCHRTESGFRPVELDSRLSESGVGRRRQDSARHHFLESLLDSSQPVRTERLGSNSTDRTRTNTASNLNQQREDRGNKKDLGRDEDTWSLYQFELAENLLTPSRTESCPWTIEDSTECKNRRRTGQRTEHRTRTASSGSKRRHNAAEMEIM